MYIIYNIYNVYICTYKAVSKLIKESLQICTDTLYITYNIFIQIKQ